MRLEPEPEQYCSQEQGMGEGKSTFERNVGSFASLRVDQRLGVQGCSSDATVPGMRRHSVAHV